MESNLIVYSNVTDIKKDIKKSKFNIKYMSVAKAKPIIEKSKVVYIDTETYPKNLDRQTIIDIFISAHISAGKKVTAVTHKSAESNYQQLRKEHSLNPYLANVRLLQIKTDKGDLFVFDSLVEDFTPIVKAIKGKPVAVQNAKFDYKMLRVNYNYEPGDIYDTMIGHKLIKNAETVTYYESHLANVIKYATKVEIAKGHGADDWSQPITIEMFDYSVEDIMYLDKVVEFQTNNLNSNSLLTNTKKYWNGKLEDTISIIEMKFVKVLADVELRGVTVNKEKLKQKLKEVEEKLAEENKPFIKAKLNTSSPKQIMEYLEQFPDVDVMGTSKEELTKFAHVPIVDKLLKVKVLQKQVQMIYDYINIHPAEDGKIYADYNQMRATDGRMSCREPNLQQIPRILKKIFYFAHKTRAIIKADYPAIEARIMGVISGDSKIIKIFKDKKDMHSETASSFLKKSVKEITEEERRKAKAANFGFMFGMGALTYIRYAYTNYGLIVSLEESQLTRDKYLKEYSGVKRFHDTNSKSLKENYEIVIKTILGRRMKCDSFTNANNYPVQGSAVDMIKLACVIFDAKVREAKIDAGIINIIHDELVVDCAVKDKTKAKKILKSAMETAANFILEIFDTIVEVEDVNN